MLHLQRQEEELKRKQDHKERFNIDLLCKKDSNKALKEGMKKSIQEKREMKMRQIQEESNMLKDQKKV